MSSPRARWGVPENRALQHRHLPMGLPKGYAALLVGGSALMFALTLWLVLALWVLGFGWFVGTRVAARDQFAFAILAKNRSLPKRMLPA